MCELSSVTPLWLFGKPINVRCVLRYYYLPLSLCCPLALPRSHLGRRGTMHERESNTIETIETDLNKRARVHVRFYFFHFHRIELCVCVFLRAATLNEQQRHWASTIWIAIGHKHELKCKHTHTLTLSRASITRYLRSREHKCSCVAVKVVLP